MVKKETEFGFTLLELLVVVVILGILASVGLGQFYTAQKRGRDAQRKENLSSLKKALEMYYNDYGQYPLESDGLIKVGESVLDWGDEFSDGKTIYMKQLPKDPANGLKYFYESDDSGSYFKLYSFLEHGEDQDIGGSYNSTDCDASEETTRECNYCLASPNARCN